MGKRDGWRFRVILGMRVVALVVAACMALSGHYPPLNAQAETHGDSSAVQDEKISEIRTELASQKATLQKQWDQVNDVKTNQTHLEGVMEGFGTLLTLMVGGSITLQIRKPK